MTVKLEKDKKTVKFNEILKKIPDIIIFKTISLSQDTMQYQCLKPEIVSLAHKAP